MKKYKHIKTGYIAECISTYPKYQLNDKDETVLPGIIVENSSDWKEIIKKEYEILSFREINGKKLNATLQKDGNYSCVELLSNVEGYSTEKDMLGLLVQNDTDLQYVIYSIKRLSDGEVFTIGDIINCQKDQNQILLEIKIYNEKIRFKMEFQKNYDWDSSYTLDFINKPNKLFTTEDGVEIFDEKQKLFWLDWSLGKNGMRKPSIHEYSLSFCPLGDKTKYKYFINKENAIYYHEEHLAHFSWDDIESAYGKIAPLHSPLYINLIKELKNRL